MEAIKLFLSISYGSGDGDGSGSGDGSGDGDGDGDGSGDGSGSGYGSGDGSGDGILSMGAQKIHEIDGVKTIIYSTKGNVARCAILNTDLTLDDCYVAKWGTSFAHGKTSKIAIEEAKNKELSNSPIEERIGLFKSEFSKNKKYPAINFYKWHSILTGSCSFGKENFVKNKSIDLENDKMTVKEFIDLTKNEYGGEVIMQLANDFN